MLTTSLHCDVNDNSDPSAVCDLWGDPSAVCDSCVEGDLSISSDYEKWKKYNSQIKEFYCCWFSLR